MVSFVTWAGASVLRFGERVASQTSKKSPLPPAQRLEGKGSGDGLHILLNNLSASDICSGRFVLRPQAARTQVEPLPLSCHQHIGGMNVGFRPAISVTLGMADVLAELHRFPADIALQFLMTP